MDIEPALTRDEWNAENGRGSCEREGFSIYRPEGAEVVVIASVSHPGVGFGDAAAAAVMALANAQLPDDDPRKITRGDVVGLRHRAVGYEDNDDFLLAVAAKLAALLPPE